MIWHIVRLDTSALDEAARRDLERDLEGLAAIDEVAWLHVARDLDDPTVVGLLTVFRDVDDLAAYRVHPLHTPVLARLRELELPAVRLDVTAPDDVELLP